MEGLCPAQGRLCRRCRRRKLWLWRSPSPMRRDEITKSGLPVPTEVPSVTWPGKVTMPLTGATTVWLLPLGGDDATATRG